MLHHMLKELSSAVLSRFFASSKPDIRVLSGKAGVQAPTPHALGSLR